MQVFSVSDQPISEPAASSLLQLQGVGEGRNFGSPYPDARALVGILGESLGRNVMMSQGSFEVDADGVLTGAEIYLSYTPRFLLIFNRDLPVTAVKLATMPGLFSFANGAYTDNTIKAGNFSGTDPKAFYLHPLFLNLAGNVIDWMACA